ncbi:MAG TPA: NAD(P)H-hydrate dehydratase [Candidatus Cottocaccamicrobium excrementipullorum]|nr:NAD(P)H-hydrate dehydratase [Candidatus Cottocaccamicrobium excrementipullorum]
MKRLVTGKQMKAMDSWTIEHLGIPSLVLMERAALEVARQVMARADKSRKIWCACGCGNNGADGIAAARILHLAGYSVVVIYGGDREKASDEFKLQASVAEKLGISLIPYEEFIPGRCDVLIDGVFGIGLSRPVGGVFKEFLQMLAQAEPELTVAVDMPSGISSDTGKVMGTAVKADVTVTFGWQKLGSVLYPGRLYCGEVITADIGFPASILEKRTEGKEGIQTFCLEKEDLSSAPSRPDYSNKGTYGKVLIVAGSPNMGGAAYLSARAAYRAGAGLVKIFTSEENRGFLHTRLPEAILETYEAEDFLTCGEACRSQVEACCSWADAVVLGPGLGQKEYSKNLVEMVLTTACTPIIVDADALNIITANPGLTSYYTENIIITPHLGEMSRLTGKTIPQLQEDVAGAARAYADEYGITCVLKDAATAAALRDGRTFINTSGNSAMAKAGSGDVLTGVIAAFLAQGMDEIEGTALGVYVHGLAGDLWRKENGAYGLLAGELADYVGKILGENRI